MRLGIIDGEPIYPETRFAHISEQLDREAAALLDQVAA